VQVAQAMQVQPDDLILDMCSAPGGKLLSMFYGVSGRAQFVANERSSDRRRRLLHVIQEYIPQSLTTQIKVTGHDAEKWGLHQKNHYDRILLDAPCSSERHLLGKSELLKEWTPKRSKNLAHRQYAMLVAALTALKPGGRLVYSTCALSHFENDHVIEKLADKYGHLFVNITPTLDLVLGNASAHGQMILPDADGFGPMYCAVLQKYSPVE
jgi:16S rRNA C967 or C1407 C5-methylase (RsmB/RsmF family)